MHLAALLKASIDSAHDAIGRKHRLISQAQASKILLQDIANAVNNNHNVWTSQQAFLEKQDWPCMYLAAYDIITSRWQAVIATVAVLASKITP